MKLEVFRSPTAICVQVTGRFVLEDCEAVKARVTPFITPSIKQVSVDLEKTEFMDSAGLGVLVGIKVSANKNGFQFVLLNPSPAIEDILKVSKLSSIFDIFTGPEAEEIKTKIVRPEFIVTETKDETFEPSPTDTLVEEENRQASFALERADYFKAVQHYQRIIERDPANLTAHTNLALVFEKKPTWRERAIEQWERVLAVSRRLGDDIHIQRARERLSALRK